MLSPRTTFCSVFMEVFTVPYGWLLRKLAASLQTTVPLRVYITQKNVSKKSAEVTVKVKVDNTTLTPVPLELENAIYDRNGKLVKKHSQNFELTPQGVQNYSSHFRLNNPHLWQGREDPYLYKVVSRLMQNGRVIDEVIQPWGFASMKS